MTGGVLTEANRVNLFLVSPQRGSQTFAFVRFLREMCVCVLLTVHLTDSDDVYED